jgi:hypothetical protein
VTFPIPFRPPFAAAGGSDPLGGGTLTTDGGYQIRTFTSSGSLTVTTDTYVDLMMVAGGGGGGTGIGVTGAGGGGGGGELVFASMLLTSAGSPYTVTVGTGGAGSTANGVKGTSGGNSTFNGLTAIGGGGGGSAGAVAGVSGGSGGGGAGVSGAGGASTASDGYGNAGGASGQYAGGGGGGAGAAAPTSPAGHPAIGGAGGDGLSSNITGTLTSYGGGGGGGGNSGATASYADSSAGAGGYEGQPNGVAAPSNLGGGGGGGLNSNTDGNGGAGGDGVVIVRYKTDATAAFEPTDLQNAVAWWDAGSGVTDISTAVTDWEDKIGGVVATDDDTANRRPTLNSTGLNSLPTIEFDASTERLDFDTGNMPIGSAARTVFGVAQPGAVRSLLVGWGPLTANSVFHIEIGNYNDADRFGLNTEAVYGSLADTDFASPRDFEIVAASYEAGANANTTQGRFNGEDQAEVLTGTGVMATVDSDGSIGNRSVGSAFTGYPKIADVMIFNTTLSTFDIQKLEGWAAHNYNLRAFTTGDRTGSITASFPDVGWINGPASNFVDGATNNNTYIATLGATAVNRTLAEFDFGSAIALDGVTINGSSGNGGSHTWTGNWQGWNGASWVDISGSEYSWNFFTRPADESWNWNNTTAYSKYRWRSLTGTLDNWYVQEVAFRELNASKILPANHPFASVAPKRGYGVMSAPVYIGTETTGATQPTNHTFSSVSIGTAAATRHVVVCVGSNPFASGNKVTGVTIGGVTATEYANVSGTNSASCIYGADVPTGTTGDIAITANGQTYGYTISVYTVDNVTQALGHMEEDQGTTATINLNLPSSRGAAIIAIVKTNSGTTYTWNGPELTEDMEAIIFNAPNKMTTGSGVLTGSNSLAETVTLSSSGAHNRVCAVALV